MEINETLQQRGSRYGQFKDHAAVAQALKDICQKSNSWPQMGPVHKEALEMIMHKIARILCGDPDYIDSWHDIVGYAKLVENYLQQK